MDDSMQTSSQTSEHERPSHANGDLAARAGDVVAQLFSTVNQAESSQALEIFRIAEGLCLSYWSFTRWQTSEETPGLAFQGFFGPTLGSLHGMQAWLAHLSAPSLWATASLCFVMVAAGVLPRAAALVSAVIIAGRNEVAAPGADFELVIMGFLSFWLAVLPVGSGLVLLPSAKRKFAMREVPATASRLCVASLVVLYANARFWSVSVSPGEGTLYLKLLWLVPCLMILRSVPLAHRLLLVVQPLFHFGFWLTHGALLPHVALALTTLLSCRRVGALRTSPRRVAAGEEFGAMSSPLSACCALLFLAALTAQVVDAAPVAAVSLQWIHDLACPTRWLILR